MPPPEPADVLANDADNMAERIIAANPELEGRRGELAAQIVGDLAR